MNQIVILWPQIAGEAAQWTRPIAISASQQARRETTLKLEIDSGRGPIATMMIPELIAATNKACGFDAIHAIRLQQTSQPKTAESPKRVSAMPKQKLEEITQDISAPELRASLIRIGKRLRKS